MNNSNTPKHFSLKLIPISPEALNFTKEKSLNIEHQKVNENEEKQRISNFSSRNNGEKESISEPLPLIKGTKRIRTKEPTSILAKDLKKNSHFLPLIKRTIKKMKRMSIFSKFDKLTNYHFSLINDLSFYFDSNQNHRFKKFFSLWSPYNKLIMIIKLICFLNVLLIFFWTPLAIAFGNSVGPVNFFKVSLAIVCLETVCKMNSGYFVDGVLIMSRSKVLKNYFKFNFLPDLLAILSISLGYLHLRNDGNTIDRVINFLIFSKVIHFKQLYIDLIQYFKVDIYLRGLREIIELLCISIFLAHLIPCLWYFISILSLEYQGNEIEKASWLISRGILHSDDDIKYIHSFYFSVVLMMTVGFGDITPTNTFELAFCIVSIFIGCALYGYNLSSIGLILQKIYKEENEYKEQMRIIGNFMERKKIEAGLQTRIKEYLKFIWNEKKTEHSEKEMEIIGSLSNSLKDELMLESYGGIIKAFPILYKLFSERSLKKMIGSIKEIHYVPGDIIFYEKESEEPSLYYINRGTVNLVYCGKKDNFHPPKVLEELKEGQIFGEASFFTNKPQLYTAQSKEFVSLLAIKREDFLNIIKKKSEDYEQYCMIRDQMNLNSDFKFDNYLTKCKSCDSPSHATIECNFFHYIPDREKIIKSYEYSVFQERDTVFKRNHKRKKNSESWQKEFTSSVIKFQKQIKKTTKNSLFLDLIKNQQIDSNFFGSKQSLTFENKESNSYENYSSSSIVSDDNEGSQSQSQESIVSQKSIPECKREVISEKSLVITKKSRNSKKDENLEENKQENLVENEKTQDKIEEISFEDHFQMRLIKPSFTKTESKSNNSLILPEKDNINSMTLSKQSKIERTTDKKTQDELNFFEKCENFTYYYPKFNVDGIIKYYNSKRKKNAFLKKFFNNSNESPFPIDKKNQQNSMLKNFGKYSFFPKYFENKINVTRRKDRTSTDVKNNKENQNIEPQSPFFRKKEFSAKPANFFKLTQAIISKLSTGKKK